MTTTGAEAVFFVAGGTLASDTPSYVERDVDRALFDALVSGRYCYVLNSRQMGKSSLCVRTQSKLRERGIRSAFVDLSRIGNRNIGPEQWYAGLGVEIGRAVGLQKEFLSRWKENAQLGPLQRLFDALEEVLLKGSDVATVVMIDEIDATRSLPFDADEFFAAIRDCYNKRVQDKAYERLTFCLIGAAVPSDLIKNPRITAFNIGERIYLRDFTLEEARAFGQGLGNRRNLIERIHYWTHGQPFLTQSICLAVANDASIKSSADLDAYIQRELLSPEARDSNVNLADVGKRILNSPEEGQDLLSYRASVLTMYEGILRGKARVRDDESNHLVAVLKLSGLTRTEQNLLRPRNPIYERAFGLGWIRENMPGDDLRRQKAAYKRGLVRASLGAGVVVVALAALSLVAIAERIRADANAVQSKKNLNEALANADRANLSVQEAQLAEKQAESFATQRDKAYKELKAAAALETQAKKHAEQETALALTAKNESLQSLKQAKSAETIANARTAEAKLNAKASYIANLHVASQAVINDQPELAQSILRSLRNSPNRDATYDYMSRFADTGAFVLTGPTSEATGVRFSPDGAYILASARDGTITIWRTRDSKLVKTIHAGSVNFDCIALSPDGQKVVAGTTDGLTVCYRVPSGLKLWADKTPGSINWLCFSHDGGQIARCDATGYARLFRATDGKPLRSFIDSVAQLASAAFSPDGRSFAVASLDGSVRIHDVGTLNLTRTIPTGDGLNTVCYAPGGSVLASGGNGKVVKLWDPSTGTRIGSFATPDVINAVACTPDGSKWVTTGQEGTNCLWDRTGHSLGQFKQGSNVTSLDGTFSPDGSLFATTQGPKILIRPVTVQPGLRAVTEFAPIRVDDVAISRDGSRIAVIAENGELRLLDGHTYRILRSAIIVKNQGPYGVDISPDGRLVAVATNGDARARVYDAQTMKELGSNSGKRAIRFSPSGKTLFTEDGLGNIQEREAHTGKLVRELIGHSQAIDQIAFSPNGDTMLTGSNDNTARLWDLKTGRCVKVLQPGEAPIWSVAYARNGQFFAIGDAAGWIWLYDNAGRQLSTFHPASTTTEGLAFTLDSKILVSGSQDGIVRFWDLGSKVESLSVGRDYGLVRHILCASDGRIFVCGGNGKLLVAEPFRSRDYAVATARERNEMESQAANDSAYNARVAAENRARVVRDANQRLILAERRASNRGDWAQAVRLSTQLINAMPADLEYRQMRGDAAAGAGNGKLAILDGKELETDTKTYRKWGLLLEAIGAFEIHDSATYGRATTAFLDENVTTDIGNAIYVALLDPDAIKSKWPMLDELAEESTTYQATLACWQVVRGNYKSGLDHMGRYSQPRPASEVTPADVPDITAICGYLSALSDERLGYHEQALKLMLSAEALYKRISTPGDPIHAGPINLMCVQVERNRARKAILP